MNTFFSNFVGSLNIPEYVNNGPISDNISDPIIKLILKYRKHPSLLTIGEVCKERKKNHAVFSFSKVATDIPSKIIKENAGIFASFLQSSFNTSVSNSEFPSVLKQANITPVFKKGERYLKDNYRPVCILPNVSKIFERCMFRQINEYMNAFLSRHKCSFRKGCNTQQCLFTMLEKWKSAVDNKKTFGALLTDLSKAFDCLSHELLLAKLHTYGFSISALRFVYSYLKSRK